MLLLRLPRDYATISVWANICILRKLATKVYEDRCKPHINILFE